MREENDDCGRGAGRAGDGGGFLTTAFDFFTVVLKSIAKDDVLRVLWGVEVLLFAILVFMIWFGEMTGEQRFNLALVIVASVVVTFTLSAWRSYRHRGSGAVASNEGARSVSPARAGHPEIVEQARKCLGLLKEIRAANARVVHRGRAGSGPWSTIQRDTYNNVCRTCYRRRLGGEPPDSYFDTICAEPDVATVCDKKWQLGEAVEDYRRRLDRASAPPLDHDDLELLIRRSVTLPDCTPSELQTALDNAIARAERVLEGGSGAS